MVTLVSSIHILLFAQTNNSFEINNTVELSRILLGNELKKNIKTKSEIKENVLDLFEKIYNLDIYTFQDYDSSKLSLEVIVFNNLRNKVFF